MINFPKKTENKLTICHFRDTNNTIEFEEVCEELKQEFPNKFEYKTIASEETINIMKEYHLYFDCFGYDVNSNILNASTVGCIPLVGITHKNSEMFRKYVNSDTMPFEIVRNKEELKNTIKYYITHPNEVKMDGKKCYKWIEKYWNPTKHSKKIKEFQDNEKLKISVITPVYNGAYVEETLDSVFNQTYKPTEYCITIDGNEESFKKIVSYFKEKNCLINEKREINEFVYDGITIRIKNKKNNEGIGKTLNDCILMSKGNLIAWVSADDYWLPDTLNIQITEFKKLKNKKSVILYGNYALLDRAVGKIIKTVNGINFKDIKKEKEYIRKSCFVNFSTSFIPREVFKKVGLFDPSKTYGEDFEWLMRAILVHNIFVKFIPKTLVNYGVDNTIQETHKHSTSIKMNDEDTKEKVLKLLRAKKLGKLKRNIYYPLLEGTIETKKSPFFTIVTCTYNRAKMLVNAINSVINQEFTDWELIIVNDCSTDNTDKIIKPFLSNKKIKYIKNKKNLGNYKARKPAYNIAKGIYITTLDDDDELPQTALKIRHDKLKEDKFPPILHSNINIRYFYNGKWIIRPWFANPEVTYTDVWHNKQTDEYCQIIGATMTIRKDIFKKVGFWDYDNFPENGADVEFALRLFKLGIKVSFCKEKTLTYNFHKGQLTGQFHGVSLSNLIKKIKSMHSLDDEPHIYNKYFNDTNPMSNPNEGLIILNIHPRYDCAGVGILLTNAINEFSKHKCYHIIGEETFLKHDYQLKIGVDDKKIKELVEQADIIHFNKYLFDANPGIHFIEPYLKDKKCVLHLHGNLDIWNGDDSSLMNAVKKYNMTVVSCSPLTELILGGCIWLPNPLPTHEESYLPIHKDWHGDLKLIHTVINPYNKGTDDLIHALKYLKDGCKAKIDYKILDGSNTLKETLNIKKQYHVCVDNITQGFVGMAGWESMSQQLACISRLDTYVKKRYKEVLSPNDKLPIIDVNGIDQMAMEIIKLSKDMEYRYNTAIYSRKWMEKNYNINKITKLWVDFYESL